MITKYNFILEQYSSTSI